VHDALAETVRKVQGSNLQCDDMWQTWVETFGKGKLFDPKQHEAEFLLAFLQHVETVQLTLATHEQLSEQIKLRTIKDSRVAERQLPEEVVKRVQQGATLPLLADKRSIACAVTQTETDDSTPSIPQVIPHRVDDVMSGIPNYIWMSAPSYDAISQWYKDHLCDLMHRAPGWKLFFVNDQQMQEVITKHCSEREQMCFSRINPKYGPAKADFGRYILMRRYGGLWLDLKSGWQGDLSKNLSKFGPLPPLVLGHWGWPNQHEHIPQDVNNYGETQQWWLMSAPGHAIWDKVLAAVCDNIEKYSITTDGVGKQAVITVTGPVAMSRVMYPELLERCPHLLLKDKEYKFEYDMLGTHAKKQNQLGGHATHYSKLKEPVILPTSAGSSSSAVPVAYCGSTDILPSGGIQECRSSRRPPLNKQRQL
jgi:mannosyltransferase OCH1-like enzyme